MLTSAAGGGVFGKIVVDTVAALCYTVFMLGQNGEGKMAYTFDENLVSDLHKDAHGFRPSEWFWAEWTSAADAEKQRIWDQLLAALDATIAEDRRREELAVGDFERGIRQNLAFGASSRGDAIRWMLDGVLQDHDLWYGGEYACYLFNLPYSYRTELDPIVAQIQQDREQKVVDTEAA